MRISALADHRVVAVIDGGAAVDLGPVLAGPTTRPGPDAVTDQLAVLAVRGEQVRAYLAGDPPQLPVAELPLAAPSPRPATVLAAPVNYREHAGELGGRSPEQGRLDARQLGLIVLAPASVTGPAGRIELPDLPGREFHYEGEIAIVIGRPARGVPVADALDHVLGYTGLIDVTLRLSAPDDPVPGREERSMRKSYHTFTPTGPYLLTADEVPDPAALTLQLSRNGEPRQQGRLADLIVGVAELVSRASAMLPLLPGDLIATGTPAGVGLVLPGDQLSLRVSGVGELRVPVVRRDW
jgi:2-keto-4-pentenoate hydratase/2-oxohepta-3-ene-1,7-dioic acid hydratase in catechol pathway